MHLCLELSQRRKWAYNDLTYISGVMDERHDSVELRDCGRSVRSHIRRSPRWSSRATNRALVVVSEYSSINTTSDCWTMDDLEIALQN